MLGTINLATFIVTGIGLNMYPGPDTMYIISRTLSQGKRAGILSALGISTGGLCHTLLAGIGLSSILLASPRAFQFVRTAGALYLVHLGIRCLLGGKRNDEMNADTYLARQSGLQIYRQGVLTNLFNPKVALFFLSFLPQFVDPVNNHGIVSFLFLGSIFLATGTAWCLMIAVCSARVAERLRKSRTIVYYMEKATGVLFIILGLLMFF
ncbi:MAG TPA: LysE family translocator [Spirochaetota bacterium]|nr:LysE family translocator [Spirochaetota bacterium]HRS79066.1 LysE family translocator [Spirochaetota bacterium]HRT76948.1 LysE family translocator [Spirochaetota bacterium]